jgi:hypothetical protein
MNKLITSSILAALALAGSLQAQTTFVRVSQIPGNLVNSASTSPLAGRCTVINQDQVWTADKVYIIENLTFVEAPAVLRIEPGTIVRMEPKTTGGSSSTDPADVGALIITRGAKIVAPGTSESPIIFTNVDDPFVPGGASTIPSTVNGAAYTVRDYTLTSSGNINKFKIDGDCGGLVILGKTRLAFNNASGTAATDPVANPLTTGAGRNFIEGFQAIDDTVYGTAVTAQLGAGSASGGKYGGTDDNDNSGRMSFCSVRYGGFILSTGNEINGITTGAVGRATVMEFCEVYNNADDDFEHFGGTLNTRYCAGLFGGDDGADIDQGYRGQNQFWFQIQDNSTAGGVATGRNSANYGDCTGEWDGQEAPDGVGFPGSVFTFFNATTIGRNSGKGINWKLGSGGKVFNSIWANAGKMRLESSSANTPLTTTAAADGNTAINRFLFTRTSGGEFNEAGVAAAATEPDAMFKYSTIQGTAGANSVTGYWTGTSPDLNTLLGTYNITYTATTPLVNQAVTAGTLDPRLQSGVAQRTGGIRPSVSGPSGAARSTWFVDTAFQGAFKDANWLAGWSILESVGVSPAAGFATARFPIPTITRVGTGSTAYASVSFPVENGVQYSVQTSTDGGKTYLPVNSATGLTNGLYTATSDTTATVNLAAGSGAAMLHVRVMPL